MLEFLQALARMIAIATAVAGGATSVQDAPPEQRAIFEETNAWDNPAAVPVLKADILLEFEGRYCGTYEDEPCYVIVHVPSLLVETGP